MSKPRQAQTPKRKHVKLYWLTGLSLLIIAAAGQIAWQLSYSDDTAVPYARLMGQAVGGQSRLTLSSKIQKDFQKANVHLTTASNEAEIPLTDLGATVSADTMVSRLNDYPTGQRFIPLSIFWQRPAVDRYEVSFSDAKLQAISDKVSTALSSKPRDASLAIKKGKLVVTSAKVGEVVAPETVRQVITSAKFHQAETRLAVPSTTTQPRVSDEAVAPVKQKAESIINRSYKLLTPDGKTITPTRSDIVKWLVIRRSGTTYSLKVSKPALQKYAGSLTAKVGRAATYTWVHLVDGLERSRQKGTPGAAVNATDLTRKLENALASNEPGVAMDILLQPVPSPVTYTRSYTSSQAGLSAYVNYVTSTQNIRVAVKQLSGKGWSAYGRAYESTVSASTYKLYVSLWLFDQMDKGKIKWSDPWLDTTVSGCFDRMTIASTNPCAEAWINKVGRDNLNKFIYNHGFSRGTTFTNPVATHTTANDLLVFMTGLHNGSLIGGAHRDRLFHSLSVHPYRSGVPAGSAGTVKDKVGFLWDYVNDAAVVYHPKGTYVIVVMTKGYSYGKIAEITREIERIMY